MKNTIKIILITLGLIAGMVFAERLEPCDPCTDELIQYLIFNDPAYTGGVLTAPGAGTDVSTGCPIWYDSMAAFFFPDTLPLSYAIDSALAAHGGTAIISAARRPRWWHVARTPGIDSVEIPPKPPIACCYEGIYWKSKMFDAATSTWSQWTDNDIGAHGVWRFGPYLMVAVNTGAFKTPDYSGNMVFDCNVDTVVTYVWDCTNEDRPDTRGEFGHKKRTYPPPSPDGINDTIILRRYGPRVDIPEGPKVPREYFLLQNTPNPFNAKTVIEYGLPVDAEVNIEITNLLGQKVATLVNEYQEKGYKRIVWDGKDQQGHELPSGVYFYSINANEFSAKKRAILMK